MKLHIFKIKLDDLNFQSAITSTSYILPYFTLKILSL